MKDEIVTVYQRPLTVLEAAIRLHSLGAWLASLRYRDGYWEATVCSATSSAVVAGADAEDAVRTAILIAKAWRKGRMEVVVERGHIAREGTPS